MRTAGGRVVSHLVAHVPKGRSGTFEVVSINNDGKKITGVTLLSGEIIEAPIVINAAGPHASKINRMAGVAEEMNIRHRPLRQDSRCRPGEA